MEIHVKNTIVTKIQHTSSISADFIETNYDNGKLQGKLTMNHHFQVSHMVIYYTLRSQYINLILSTSTQSVGRSYRQIP